MPVQTLMDRVIDTLRNTASSSTDVRIVNASNNLIAALLRLREIGGSIEDNAVWNGVADGNMFIYVTTNSRYVGHIVQSQDAAEGGGVMIAVGPDDPILTTRGNLPYLLRIIGLMNIGDLVYSGPVMLEDDLEHEILATYNRLTSDEQVTAATEARGLALAAATLAQEAAAKGNQISARALRDLTNHYNSLTIPELLANTNLPGIIQDLHTWSPVQLVDNPAIENLLTNMGNTLPHLFGPGYVNGPPTAAEVGYMQSLINGGTVANVFAGAASTSTGAPAYTDFATFVAYILQIHTSLLIPLGVLPSIWRGAADSGFLPPPPPPPASGAVLAVGSGASSWSVYDTNPYLPIGEIGVLNAMSTTITLRMGTTTSINLNWSDATHPLAQYGRLDISNYNPDSLSTSIHVYRMEAGSHFTNNQPHFFEIATAATRSGDAVTVSFPEMKLGATTKFVASFVGNGVEDSLLLGLRVGSWPGTDSLPYNVSVKQSSPVWTAMFNAGVREPNFNAPLATLDFLGDAEDVIAHFRSGLTTAKISEYLSGQGRNEVNVIGVITLAQKLLGCSNQQILNEATLAGQCLDRLDWAGYEAARNVLHAQLMEREKMDGVPKVYHLDTDFNVDPANPLRTDNINGAAPSDTADAAAAAVLKGLQKSITAHTVGVAFRLLGYETVEQTLGETLKQFDVLTSLHGGICEGQGTGSAYKSVELWNVFDTRAGQSNFLSQYNSDFDANYSKFAFATAIATTWG